MQTSSFYLSRDTPGGIRNSRGVRGFIPDASKMPYVKELAPERAWLKLPKEEYESLLMERLAKLNA